MVKRIAAVISALLLIPAAALAGLQWREDTPALGILKNYTESINKLLTETGEQPINSLFSCYPAEAVMGITAEDNAEIPEGVEITVKLYYETLNSLQLRVSDPDRFPGIAAAIVRALYGEAMTQDDAINIPADRAKRAKNEPNASFEEPVDDMNGNVPRVCLFSEPVSGRRELVADDPDFPFGGRMGRNQPDGRDGTGQRIRAGRRGSGL